MSNFRQEPTNREALRKKLTTAKSRIMVFGLVYLVVYFGLRSWLSVHHPELTKEQLDAVKTALNVLFIVVSAPTLWSIYRILVQLKDD